MKSYLYKYILIPIAGIVLISGQPGMLEEIRLTNLRCEMLANPEGIDRPKPQLGWEISGSQRNIGQTAYQVIVASTPDKLAAGEGDLWNSGIVKSSQSVHVPYTGKHLRSRTKCYWKVKVWSNKGESKWSQPAYWSMGLLDYTDWKGRWIGLDRSFSWDREEKFSRLSARYFRKEFKVSGKVKQAMVYIIGLGLYELYINGQRIGSHVLAPTPTDYTKSVKYNTFNVTELLAQGKNTIATVLGNGRYYTMRQAYKPYKIKTFGYPKMLLQLEIKYADGTGKVITTDDSWKVTADGPIRSNNEYDGEENDATKEMPGWNDTGFNDRIWLNAEYVQEPGGSYEAQMNDNMKVMETIRPVAITLLKPGTYILDIGQNMVGWLKMRVQGNKGEQVTLRFAETLKKNGELYTDNLRDAKVTDVYTLKGDNEEIWEPSFVYHGFRYVEIRDYPGTPTIEDFEGRVVYDDIRTVGSFETSNRIINRIYKNAFWGIRGNYKGMPLDCPQRNERQPWLGDRATGSCGETFIFDNGRLYSKWLDDIEQAQKADGCIPNIAPAFWNYYDDNMTWPGAYIMIANMLYNQYGDDQPIIRHYDSMKKWLNYMCRMYMTDFILKKDKYGDWCVPPESPNLIHSKDPGRKTDGELIATAYYFHLLYLMTRFANILDKQQDVQEYSILSEKIKDAFNDKFLNEENLQYSNNTVTANLLPLYFGMVPEKYRGGVFNNIVNIIQGKNKGHVSTGLVGVQWLMRGLTENGRPDIAYKLATNTDYPSWGYMAENGATTIWELWNGNTADPSMNSHNHVMLLGDLIIWFYENLAGIKTDPVNPGFKQIEMKPSLIEGLDFVKASYHSVHGLIKSDWKKDGPRFIWSITIPGNTKAIVYIPARSENSVTEGGKEASSASGIRFIRMEGDRAVFEIGSGDYSFISEM
jgi:alpha-L-rhamnosidase